MKPSAARLLLVVFTIAIAWGCSSKGSDEGAPLKRAQLQQIAAAASNWHSGGRQALEVEAFSVPGRSYVYAALWSDGQLLARSWHDHNNRAGALETAVIGAMNNLSTNDLADVDSVEISIGYGMRRLDPGALGDDLSTVHRGARGLQVAHDGRILRFAPSQLIADNLSFERALESAAGSLNLSGQQLIEESEIATFDAHQIIVTLEAEPIATQLLRGKRLITQSEVDADRVADLAQGMADWMYSNLQPDGRMTYMYYPSSGRESSSNNMIRQWMASLAFSRMAVGAPSAEREDAATRNIRYNLDQFYSIENGLGLIEYKGKVKLGAVALAALAMLEHPSPEQFREEIKALVAMTDHLWREDGSFQTFYRPAARSSEPALFNFYPGEALLLWATLLRKENDPVRAERFLKSLRHYREWHLANRKPSFIPWHTQAYFMRWQDTGDAEYRDWIFEMNDWLLEMQENSRQFYDDTLGRFYNPLRPDFGPPHASSTGVYLEGLIDAWSLASSEGDTARAEAYRRAINGGLRSLRQLQFLGGPEEWFVEDRERVRGGLRTTVYNNVIRVDNVQHGLLGIQKIMAAYAEKDYRR